MNIYNPETQQLTKEFKQFCHGLVKPLGGKVKALWGRHEIFTDHTVLAHLEIDAQEIFFLVSLETCYGAFAKFEAPEFIE